MAHVKKLVRMVVGATIQKYGRPTAVFNFLSHILRMGKEDSSRSFPKYPHGNKSTLFIFRYDTVWSVSKF
jgi:hypothetical protein